MSQTVKKSGEAMKVEKDEFLIDGGKSSMMSRPIVSGRYHCVVVMCCYRSGNATDGSEDERYTT